MDLLNGKFILPWDAVSCHLCWDGLLIMVKPALSWDAELPKSGRVVTLKPARWNEQMSP